MIGGNFVIVQVLFFLVNCPLHSGLVDEGCDRELFEKSHCSRSWSPASAIANAILILAVPDKDELTNVGHFRQKHRTSCQKIVSPGSKESLIEGTLEASPIRYKVLVPGSQRSFVITSKYVNIFNKEQALRRSCDLCQRG